jgi:hypothetical protein
VTLTATPTANQTLTSWSGGGCSGTASTCVVTMSAAESVTATFSVGSPVNESYACVATVPILGAEDVTLALTIQGTLPATEAPSATFSMTQFQIVATLPGSFTTEVTGAGYTSMSGQGTTLDIVNQKTSGTVNPAAGSNSAYAFGPITLVSGQAVVVSLPATAATIGTWTAASTTGSMSFVPGALDMTLVFSGTDGELGSPLTIPVTCAAPASPAVFAITTVN